MNRKRLALATLCCACVSVVAAITPAAALKTSVKSYVKPVGSRYAIEPLLSVGDRVPESSNPAQQYQMVGIPDGLGMRSVGGGNVDLWMNHELTTTAQSEPTMGQPLNRGALVSKYRLDSTGNVISGERAYDTVFNGDTLVGPAAEVGNTTPAFNRFCSATLADVSVGFDRAIFMTGEESDTGTFDPLGGSSVAVFGNEAHVLPKLGHFARENEVPMPGTGSKTVVFVQEDGPSTPDSQLYMYVGDKVPAATSVISKNGLDNGKLYALKLTGHTTEDDLTSGSSFGSWVEIANADTLSSAQIETAADTAGAFGFYRIEDGTASKASNRQFHFVTTGAGGTNRLGRQYRLTYDPTNPIGGGALLKVVDNADSVIAAGGDTAISPDNIDASSQALMVNEDGTTDSRLAMADKGRDGSVWRFSLDGATRERVAELNPPGRDGVPVGPGIWETSGVIDASSIFGADTWVLDVQAHSPTAAPVANTVEDGQLLIMRPQPASAPPVGTPPPTTPPVAQPGPIVHKKKKCKKKKTRAAKKKCKRKARA